MRWLRGTLAAVALLLASSADAQAQDWWWGITWNMSVNGSLPASSDNNSDFISDFSFRGVGVEARYSPQRGGNVSYGFSGSWNALDEEIDGQTGSLPGVDLTAEKQLRYMNIVPLLVNVHYYLGDQGNVRPYFGVNVGTYWIERRVDISLLAVTEDNWHVGWAPEAGVVLPLQRPHLAAFANVRYNWALSAGGTGDQKYWGFNVGFAYR